MRVLGIIPARFASSRFPGKPLAKILGIPMVCWVAEGATRAKLIDDVIVTSDDKRILDAARSRGYHTEESGVHHTCGTERVWEVAENQEADIVINIQGDVPTVSGKQLDACVAALKQNDMADCMTLRRKIRNSTELMDPDLVKVVVDDAGKALYFSRSTVPWAGDGTRPQPDPLLHWAHIGVYAYRTAALKRFAGLPPAHLEKAERLEQLRGMAAGLTYFTIETEVPAVDVNRPEDIPDVEAWFRKRMEDEV